MTLRNRYGGVVARFDHADEELKLAVESEGGRFHRGDVMRAKDKRRDQRTDGYGYLTERVTWWEVRRQAAVTRRRILTVRDARRSRQAA